MSRTAPRPTPTKGGYPPWAVAAVVVVGIGLVGAAVRVATLDPKRSEPVPVAAPLEVAKPPAPRTEPPKRPEPKPEPKPEPPKPPEEPPPPPAPTHATAWVRGETKVVKVERVKDGDTLRTADGLDVRLLGINTPEKTGDKPLSADATALLRELVEGQQVTLEFDQERLDQYKRTLAYVHKGDLFVNGEIVRRGLAYCFTWEPNVAHRDELIGYQREARDKKAGLWSLPPPIASDHYLGDRRYRRFHRPECKFAKTLPPERRMELRNRDAALDDGLNPCDECGP